MKLETLEAPEESLQLIGLLRHRDIAQLVKKANRFKCGVSICLGRQRVDGKSIMAVSGLRFACGATFAIEAWGIDAYECLEALNKVASRGLNRAAPEGLLAGHSFEREL